MKRALMAASVLAVFAGTHAFAQTVGVGPAETIIVEPEQRTVIKQYVVKERVAPVRVKERISVGATLPADIELRSVPTTWGPKLSKYRYVYSDDHVYLVEPSNRTVIQVIE
jgi:catalase (peroxidase I)